MEEEKTYSIEDWKKLKGLKITDVIIDEEYVDKGEVKPEFDIVLVLENGYKLDLSNAAYYNSVELLKGKKE